MSAKYSYGISGMREAKTVASAGTTSSTTSLWAGMQLVAERDADGSTYRYLYGPGGAPLELSVTASGGDATSYAYQLDHAGSVIALTSATGTVVASYAYDPWGNPTSVGGTNPTLAARQPLRYRGYYWDGESALYCMPARYYDPSVGRFISADPAPPSAGSPLSLNRYVYCEGDPVGASDPTGAYADGGGGGGGAIDNQTWSDFLNSYRAGEEYMFFTNDCHNQLEGAFHYIGVYYPGARNGRANLDEDYGMSAFRSW